MVPCYVVAESLPEVASYTIYMWLTWIIWKAEEISKENVEGAT